MAQDHNSYPDSENPSAQNDKRSRSLNRRSFISRSGLLTASGFLAGASGVSLIGNQSPVRAQNVKVKYGKLLEKS